MHTQIYYILYERIICQNTQLSSTPNIPLVLPRQYLYILCYEKKITNKCIASAEVGLANSFLDKWDSNDGFFPICFVFLTVHMRERRLFKWYAIFKKLPRCNSISYHAERITQQNLSSNAEPKPPKIGGVTKS